MNQNSFFESFTNQVNVARVQIDNQIFEINRNIVDQNGKGGILEILFRQKESIINKGEIIELHGDSEKARQLKTYLEYISPQKIYVQKLSLYDVAQKVMDLVCCGIDLNDALDHFGAKDGSGDVVGEILSIMGESFVTVLVEADSQGSWEKIIYEGLNWAFANRAEEIQSNADLLAIVYQKYNNFVEQN